MEYGRPLFRRRQHILVVHNARKPRQRVAAFAHALRRRGMFVEIATTFSTAAGESSARAGIARGANAVVVAGGDGTVRSVLGPVLEHQVPLGLLPLGTANDLAVHLGLLSMNDCVEAVLGGLVAYLDSGRCEYATGDAVRNSPFCTSAGVGIAARAFAFEGHGAIAGAKKMAGNAIWPFLVAASTVKTEPHVCRIHFDEHVVEQELSVLEISKIPTPGGFALMPDADPQSGIFHAWWGGCNTVQRLGVLGKVLAPGARHLRDRYMSYASHSPFSNPVGACDVQRIAVSGTRQLPVHVNGDHVGHSPVRFELARADLPMLVPASQRARALQAPEAQPPKRRDEKVGVVDIRDAAV